MALPFPWCIYEEYQSKAAQCGQITNGSWGIEHALTHLLDAVEDHRLPTNQEDLERSINRTIATGSWNERNHARLRYRFLHQESETNEERRILARAHLDEIRRNVSATDWDLLEAIGIGFTHSEIAGGPGASTGSIRTHISRLRMNLRAAAQVGEGATR